MIKRNPYLRVLFLEVNARGPWAERELIERIDIAFGIGIPGLCLRQERPQKTKRGKNQEGKIDKNKKKTSKERRTNIES